MDFFNEIWETIARNRSRSLLTGFGVFWGMMMLLLLVGMGNSLVDGIRYQLEGVATNSCIVGANDTGKAYKGLQKGRAWDIRNGDIPYLEREVTSASTIAYVRFIGSWEKNTHRGDKVGTYNLLGVSENLQQALCTPLQYGRFINAKDVEQQRKVCVIGEQTYRDLFPEGGDITGQCITVSGIQFRVVGVQKHSESHFGLGGDTNEQIKIPVTTAQQTYGGNDVIHMLFGVAKQGEQAATVLTQIKDVLRRRHTIAPDDDRAFWGQDLGAEFRAVDMLIMGLTILVWFIGLGTLLSGAIGVSNIMLVTIRERTKEIGIRRAIGASPASIVGQILAESTFLTALSGVLGIVAGVGILQAVSPLLANNEMFSQGTQVSFSVAFGGLLILIAIGLLAGLLPAKRALAIKPIEALNEE